MRADYRTPAGTLIIATILILAAALGLFVAANLLGNEILRSYLFGAAAASLGCAIILFGASQMYRACNRSCPAPP